MSTALHVLVFALDIHLARRPGELPFLEALGLLARVLQMVLAMTQPKHLTALWLVVLLGCGDPSDPEWSADSRAIINGQADTNPAHMAVVALVAPVSASQSVLCTGTLISSRVILTAAHCVGSSRWREIEVHFASNFKVRSETRATQETLIHANWQENDIGLLRMSADAPAGIEPIPFLPARLRLALTDLPLSAEWVGFGKVSAGSGIDGLKRSVKNQYDASEGNYLRYDFNPGGTCMGDSGGPGLVIKNGREYVAGVVSHGDEGCLQVGYDTRVDSYEPWIAEFTLVHNGGTCKAAADCLTGFCVGGVCCESSCNAPCQTCGLPATPGKCQVAPDGFSCSDKNPCNGEESCKTGLCALGAAPSCDDANACTTDTCEPGAGCQHPALPDGRDCRASFGAGQCQSSQCVSPSQARSRSSGPAEPAINGGCQSATANGCSPFPIQSFAALALLRLLLRRRAGDPNRPCGGG